MKYILILFIMGLSGLVLAESSEVSAAREGAPNHISDDASIMIWEDGSYIQKIKGSNEFTCFVWADKKGTFEPSCLNQAAVKSILPVYQFQRYMLENKMSIQDIHSAIEEKAKSGEFLQPDPGAVVYMMSSKNKYYDHFSAKLVSVEPHIMLYYPKLNENSLGFNGKHGMPGFYSDFPHLSVVHIHTDASH